MINKDVNFNDLMINEDNIRKVLPIYLNTNNGIVSSEIKIYNPTKKQLEDKKAEIDSLDSEDKIMFFLLDNFTNIDMSNANIQKIEKFLSTFDYINSSVQAELSLLWNEITIFGLDMIERFADMDDSRKAKMVLLNKDMANVFEQLKQIQEQMVEEEPSPTPSEEELEIMRKAEELKAKYKKE